MGKQIQFIFPVSGRILTSEFKEKFHQFYANSRKPTPFSQLQKHRELPCKKDSTLQKGKKKKKQHPPKKKKKNHREL